ncbi:MAG TPA: phage holin family protein [Candidatus Paceibacterota bacterium]|nr:phage holin family protein [Candidatus Paceibacterota bacterium]
MKIILHWVLVSISVFLTSKIISGITIDPLYTALVVGACLSLFSMFIKPIINVLTLPINIVTLGLFSLVINGAVFWFLGTLIKGFGVSTFTAAFVGALVVAILNWILNKVFHFDI